MPQLEFRSKWAQEALTKENMSSWAHAGTPTPKHSCSSEQIKQAICLQAAELRHHAAWKTTDRSS